MKKENFNPGIIILVLLLLPAILSAQSMNDEYIFPVMRRGKSPFMRSFPGQTSGWAGFWAISWWKGTGIPKSV